MIHTILKNENYIGNIVYNRTTRRLGQKQMNNPHHSGFEVWRLSIQSSIQLSLRAPKKSWPSGASRSRKIRCC